MNHMNGTSHCDPEAAGPDGPGASASPVGGGSGSASGPKRYYGKYRGKVVNNVDPMFVGRVQVSCPNVLGTGRFAWAMPCTPYAGPQVGLYAVPPVGANVWVEFEGGDPDYPIVGGCFWGTGEAPAAAAFTPGGMTKVLQTDSISFMLDDTPGAGGAFLDVLPPAVGVPLFMAFDSNGYEISGGPASISITPDSITVTHTTSTVTVTPREVEVAFPPASAKVSAQGVDLAFGASTVKVDKEGVTATNATAEAKVSGSGLEIKNGSSKLEMSSADIKLSSTSVNINDGALEVMK